MSDSRRVSKKDADVIADASQVIVDALTDGLDDAEVARFVVDDPRAAGVAITMLAAGLRSQIEDRAIDNGADPDHYRATYVQAIRFHVLTGFDVDDSPPTRRRRWFRTRRG